MVARPRIRLTREGRYYLFVLAFIVGGAVLREVNLLVVLAALMVGPLLFSWRAVVMMMRRMVARRQVASRVGLGETLVATVTLRNHRKSLAGWAYVATDHVRELTRVGPALDGAGAETTSKVDVYFPMLPAGEQRTVEYRLNFRRRGRYALGPLTLSTGFPFDFLRCEQQFTEPAEVLVCPAVGRFTPDWYRRIESLRQGQQRALRRRGVASGDYYGLREWRPGDSTRWIHWRTSAKLGSVSVLQFEELRHRDLALLIDLWQPEQPSAADLAFVELALCFAATAAAEWGRRGDSELGLAVAGKEIGSWVKPASRPMADEILAYLATAEAASHIDWSRALRELAPIVQRGTRLLVISTRAAPARGELSEDDETEKALVAMADWCNVRETKVQEYLRFDKSRQES